eukprot:5587197-Prymnesium_polylepis.1
MGDEQRLAVARRVRHAVQHARQVSAQLVLRRQQPPVVRHAVQVVARAVSGALEGDDHVPEVLGAGEALAPRLEDARRALHAPVGPVGLDARARDRVERVKRVDPRPVAGR